MLGSAFSYRGIDLSTSVPSGVVDQEQATGTSAFGASGRPGGVGQQVTFGPNPSEVTGFRLFLQDVGFPVGLTRVAVYADDGGNKPTGTALAFSPYYAMESTAVSYTDYYFPLSGWTPAANTAYIFLWEVFDYFKVAAASTNVRVQTDTDEYSGGASVTSTSYTSEELGPAPAYGVSPTFDLNFTVYSVSGSTTAPDDDSIRFRDAMNRRRYGGLFR
jgi:hypothetical protein